MTADSPTAAPRHSRFHALDGLRGLAAVSVALYHFDPALMPSGNLAVDFFFALSGFVLWRTYAARLKLGAAAGGLGVGAFMRLRLIRLYPIFALGILLGAVFVVQGMVRHSQGSMIWSVFLPSFVLNMVMLPSPFDPKLYPINLPSWSLFYEILANLALAVVLVRCRAWALFAVIAAAGLGLLVLGHAAGGMGGGDGWREVPMALMRTAFSFTVGLIVAQLHSGRERRPSVVALACFAVLWGVMQCNPGPQRFLFDVFAVFVVSPALLFACSRIEPSRIAAPAAALLGEVSFALYAVHLPVAHAFQLVARKSGLPMWQVAVPYLAVALALAWICARYLDLPLRKLLTRRFG